MKDVLDNIFDAGWKEFVNEVRENNRRCNKRLFKVLASTRGLQFVTDLQKFTKSFDRDYALIGVVKKPEGVLLDDHRYSSWNQIWIDARSSPEMGMLGGVYIQVKENRWIKISYST